MSILGWLTGVPLGEIATSIASVVNKKTDAKTEQERIAMEGEHNLLIARQSVLVAEAWNRVNSFTRLALSIPAIGFIWKTVMIDKIMCPIIGLACKTDDLSGNLWYYVYLVLGFYFLDIIKRKT